jgi:hypothetical protein
MAVLPAGFIAAVTRPGAIRGNLSSFLATVQVIEGAA